MRKSMTLDVCDAETLPIEALLYQSGYLTIKEVVPPPRQTPEEGTREVCPRWILPRHGPRIR